MVMKPRIYLETSFVSYMVGKDTTNVKVATDQAWTRRWWEEIAPNCSVFISDFVAEEAAEGNPDYCQRRLDFIKDIPLLEYDAEAVQALAEKLLGDEAFPKNAVIDAFHVATASICRVDYLLTWNCTHIANPKRLPKTIEVIRSCGYDCPQIIKPSTYFEFLEMEV